MLIKEMEESFQLRKNTNHQQEAARALIVFVIDVIPVSSVHWELLFPPKELKMSGKIMESEWVTSGQMEGQLGWMSTGVWVRNKKGLTTGSQSIQKEGKGAIVWVQGKKMVTGHAVLKKRGAGVVMDSLDREGLVHVVEDFGR